MDSTTTKERAYPPYQRKFIKDYSKQIRIQFDENTFDKINKQKIEEDSRNISALVCKAVNFYCDNKE